MSQFFIVVGDKTDHGGTVLEGSPADTINGKMIARVGDKVWCPHCRCHTTIIEGDPGVLIDGKPAAYHGALTSCGAKLIASQIDNILGGEGDESSPAQHGYENPYEASSPDDEAMLAGYSPGVSQERAQGMPKPSDAEVARYMAKHHDPRTFTQDQNNLLAIRHGLTIVKQGKTVTLRARVPVFGDERTVKFNAAVMSRWDGLAYQDSDGTVYRTDVKLTRANKFSEAVIHLSFAELEGDRSQGKANGDVIMDGSAFESGNDPGTAAHEFGHAYFGLKDGYLNDHITLPDGRTVGRPAFPGMEGSLMADTQGVVRLQDLKALIQAYAGSVPVITQ